MLFNAFTTAVQKYSDNYAVNNITYRALYQLVAKHPYTNVSTATDWTVLLDILKAAMVNKPIIILPKFNRTEVTVEPHAGEFSIILYSSGSTGARKQIVMPERMIMANIENAMACQRLNFEDKILTVCSLNHTGGISAQTLAGLMCGAHIIVEQFNAFNFFRLIDKHSITVTHLIPVMIDALSKTKKHNASTLRLVVAGSDCVYRHHVEFWTSKGINFISNYGLTEAGPIIINHEFTPASELSIFDHGVPLGTNAWCQTQVVEGELWLKGRCVKTSGWLATGDCVEVKDDWYIYKGRKSAGCKIIPKSY